MMLSFATQSQSNSGMVYNVPDGAERNPDIIRSEMSLLNTPVAQAYSMDAYVAVKNVQQQCAADYKTYCAPMASYANPMSMNDIFDQVFLGRGLLETKEAEFESKGAKLVKTLQSYYKSPEDNKSSKEIHKKVWTTSKKNLRADSRRLRKKRNKPSTYNEVAVATESAAVLTSAEEKSVPSVTTAATTTAVTTEEATLNALPNKPRVTAGGLHLSHGPLMKKVDAETQAKLQSHTATATTATTALTSTEKSAAATPAETKVTAATPAAAPQVAAAPVATETQTHRPGSDHHGEKPRDAVSTAEVKPATTTSTANVVNVAATKPAATRALKSVESFGPIEPASAVASAAATVDVIEPDFTFRVTGNSLPLGSLNFGSRSGDLSLDFGFDGSNHKNKNTALKNGIISSDSDLVPHKGLGSFISAFLSRDRNTAFVDSITGGSGSGGGHGGDSDSDGNESGSDDEGDGKDDKKKKKMKKHSEKTGVNNNNVNSKGNDQKDASSLAAVSPMMDVVDFIHLDADSFFSTHNFAADDVVDDVVSDFIAAKNKPCDGHKNTNKMMTKVGMIEPASPSAAVMHTLRHGHEDDDDHTHRGHKGKEPTRGRAGSPPPPPPPPAGEDVFFNGALGYGASGDMCMYEHFNSLSAPCVESVVDLYQLRAEYWQESQQAKAHMSPHCMFGIFVVLGVLAVCVVRRLSRNGRAKKVRNFLTVLHANPTLKATVEAETGMAVPEVRSGGPGDRLRERNQQQLKSIESGGDNSNTSINTEVVTENDVDNDNTPKYSFCARLCMKVTFFAGLFMLSFILAVSALEDTGRIIYWLDHHNDGGADGESFDDQYQYQEGEERGVTIFGALLILTLVCVLKVTMVCLAFKAGKALYRYFYTKTAPYANSASASTEMVGDGYSSLPSGSDGGNNGNGNNGNGGTAVVAGPSAPPASSIQRGTTRFPAGTVAVGVPLTTNGLVMPVTRPRIWGRWSTSSAANGGNHPATAAHAYFTTRRSGGYAPVSGRDDDGSEMTEMVNVSTAPMPVTVTAPQSQYQQQQQYMLVPVTANPVSGINMV